MIDTLYINRFKAYSLLQFFFVRVAVDSCNACYDIMSSCFVTLRMLCFMIVAFPGYLHL